MNRATRSRFSRKDLLLVLAGLAFGLGLGVLILFGLPAAASSPQGGLAVPGADGPAPDFELETLSGDSVRLSELRGKPVLINFWATWCGPCRLEMPMIQARYSANKDKFTVLAVNFDEPVETVRPYVQELGLTFPVLLDPGGAVQQLYRVRGYPTSVLVDADGIVRIRHIGIMSEKQLDNYLSQLGIEQ